MTKSVTAKPTKGLKSVRLDLNPDISRRSMWQEGADFKIRCRDYWKRHRAKPKGEEILEAGESPKESWLVLASVHGAIARMRALCSLSKYVLGRKGWKESEFTWKDKPLECTKARQVLLDCVSRPPQLSRVTVLAAKKAGHNQGPTEVVGDTGSASDIIGRKDVPKELLDQIRIVRPGMEIIIANGSTITNEKIKMWLEPIQDFIDAWILEDTPCAISIGKRCRAGKAACGFYWPPNENPFLVKPDGSVIVWDASDNVPVLNALRAAYCDAKEEDNPQCPALPSLAAGGADPVPEVEPGMAVPGDDAEIPNDPSGDLLQPDVDEEAPMGPDTPAVAKSLREQAASWEHRFGHWPKNKYCWSCQCCKLQQAPALRFHSEDCGRENPDEWLELVTADNLFPEKEAIGLAGDTTGFSLLDVGTGWCDVSPAQQKTADNAVYAPVSYTHLTLPTKRIV